MKAIALSNKGLEDISALEIKELIDVKTEIKDSVVLFDATEEELALLSYKGQSFKRIMIYLGEFSVNDSEDFAKVSKIDFSKWLANDKTFAVRTEIILNENFCTQEVEYETGSNIKTDSKVELKNPDVTIFAYIFENNGYIGIDFSGDIAKRDYKIYTSRHDLKGNIAYALARLSGYDGSSDKIFANPLCTNGTIAVEAALFGTGKSVNFFNKEKFPFLKFFAFDLSKFDSEEKEAKVIAFDWQFGHVKASRNNAKIAGIELNALKSDIGWIKNSFKENEADCIAANLPHTKLVDIAQQGKELFSMAKSVLKKNGKIAVCSSALELKDIASEHGFSLADERDIVNGKEVLKIATFLNK
jgi:23S rRNA G2445 N2-methylase RlmL